MTVSDSSDPKCPRCGATVNASAAEGLCVRCLAKLNLTADSVLTGAEAQRSEPLSLEEITPYFPQLEVLACLGRGGMGVVYKARQKSLDRLVALKILAPERETNPQFAARFAREAQALARLSHPHIVTVYDFGQADGLFYLLMEYVDGVNLRQLFRDRRLEPKEALAIVPPICDALQYAHDHGVVHRDIKPENLMLDKAGRVKIADFGIARMLGSDGTRDDDQGVGTPRYMAPEQRAHSQAADHRADIYSLGVVLYEMLTGELPASQIELPSRRVQIDVRLDEIVMRALNREPALRYQNADQMKTAVETLTNSALAAWPAGRPPVFRGSESADSRGEAARARHAKKPIVVGLLIMLLAIGFSIGILQVVKNRSLHAVFNSHAAFADAARPGKDAFRKGNYDQAAVAFDELIRLNPNMSEPHRWRADASLNTHEYYNAISEYNEAIRLDPKNAMAFNGRGAVWTASGRREEAIASLDEAIKLDPKIADLPLYKRIRAVAESLPQIPPSLDFAQKARLGLDAFERREFDQALDVFNELILLDPSNSEAHRWRGDAFLNLQNYDEALADYELAIRLDPRNAMAYTGRGAAWNGKAEFRRAIASLDDAIRIDPKIANQPFYIRNRAAAEGLRFVFNRPVPPNFWIIVPLAFFAVGLSLAYIAWQALGYRKPRPVDDF